MADINRLALVTGGVTRNQDLTANSLVMQSLKLGTSELTKAKLDLLAITTDSATAVDASAQHHHDGRYRTQAELGSTGATSGADLIGTNNTPSNYSPAAATVQDHLEAIDSALASAGGTVFSDADFRIQDDGDATKQIAFEASAITTATTRTITMPDADVDLTANSVSAGSFANRTLSNLGTTSINTNLLPNSSFLRDLGGTSNVWLRGYIQLLSGSSAQHSIHVGNRQLVNNSNQVVLSWGAGLNVNSNRIQDVADPTAPQDAATKSYVDSIAAGLDPKASVRAATTAVLSGTMIANNGTPATGERAYNTTALTITWFATEGPTAIDGVTLADGDRILVKDESATSGPSAGEGRTYNGIYVRTSQDVWTRAEDHDGTPSNEVSAGNFTFVEQGTANENKGFVLQGDGDLVVDTDNIIFVQFSAATAGANTELSNLTTTSINADLDPATANSRDMGSTSLYWRNAFLKQTYQSEAAFYDATLTTLGGLIAGTGGSIPTGPSPTMRIRATSAGLAAYTDSSGVNNSTATGTVYIESGNKTAGTGNSGNISITTGSSTGGASGDIALTVGDGSTEGNFKFLKAGATAPAIGDVWTATATDGTGYWATPTPPADPSILTEEFIAGETLTAGNRAVRMADAAETAGRVYFADNDASADDDFYVVGLAVAAGESAGDPIEVVKAGPITMTAHGFTVGRPVYLGAGGALTSTAPTAVDTAVVKVGIARDANTVEVQIQTMGVN